MPTLYKSNPSTGEVYETKEFEAIPEVIDDAIKRGWFETPRWQRNPRPNGLSNDNVYERAVPYSHQEYPRTLYKAGFQTTEVKDDATKEKKLKAGWSLTPIGEVLEKEGETYQVFTAAAKTDAVAAGWKAATKEIRA